jgi:transposase
MVNIKDKGMEKFFIGVDVSKKTLDCVLYDGDLSKMKGNYHLKTTNDEDGCNKILKWMRQVKVSKKTSIFYMEYTGRYSYTFAENLAGKGLLFCMVPAIKIKGSFANARGKSDKVDAIRIAQYAYRYRDELNPTSLKDNDVMKLRDLMNDRKMLVKEMASRKNIISEYKNFPEGGRYKRAKEGLELLKKQLKEVEKEILDLIKFNPAIERNYNLLISITGISFVNAVNIIIFTDNFQSFTDSRKFAAYCGVAPFEYTSGTSVNKGVHVSKMANRTLKADLSMAARCAITHDTELRIYYKRKREEGKSFGCVLNAVKFKLIGRMFAVVKRGTPYVNTQKYAA